MLSRNAPVNEFIPIAIEVGARVEDQRAYADDPAIRWGFQPGALLPSLTANKAWRQQSFIASGVAQLVADILSVDMLDDGDLPSFVERLRRCIGNIAITEIGGGGTFIDEPPANGLVHGRRVGDWVGLTQPLAARPQVHRTVVHRMSARPARAEPVIPRAGPVARRGAASLRAGEVGVWDPVVPLAGGTMTGRLILSEHPTETSPALQAATKWYVDLCCGGGGWSGIEEAPIDDSAYLRQNAAWTNIVDGGAYGPVIIAGGPVARSGTIGIEEAPIDGTARGRRNAAWTNVLDGGIYGPEP